MNSGISMRLFIMSNRATAGALCISYLIWSATAAEISSNAFRPSDLFRTTNIWTVHFTFTPEQFEAMEPAGQQGGFLGMLGAVFGGRGGLAGFRMSEGFGTGMFLAPAFLKAGDQDKEGRLSQAEFSALGEKWFSDWDTNKMGSLSTEQVRDGINAVLGQGNAGFGMPGFNGGGFLQAPEGKRNGLASRMGIEFNFVHADLEFETIRFRDIAVRYKGNGTFLQSRGSLKRSLKVDLNKFVKAQKLAGLSKLNFHNNVTDASLMNEVLAFRLFRDAGVPAPRTAYARVLVTVPGKHDRRYFGLYSLVENVDSNFADEHYGSRKGAILKPSTPSPFIDLGDDWRNYVQPYDPKTELTSAQQQRVMDFCKLVSTASDEDFGAKLSSYVDLDEFARFMAVTVFLSSMDSILGVGQNYYVHLDPKTQRFQFIPWDQEHAFADFLSGVGQVGTLNIHHPWQREIRLLERVFKVEAFKRLYLARLDEFSKTIFKPERFHQQVDEIAAAIRTALREESEERVTRFDRVMKGEPVATGFLGAPFGSPAKPIKAFVGPRTQSVVDQLAGISQGRTPGGFFIGGFGPRGGGGGFGTGSLVGGAFVTALDQDNNKAISHEEFTQGFARWYSAWANEPGAGLTEAQLRAGMNKDLPLVARPAGFGVPGGSFPRAE